MAISAVDAAQNDCSPSSWKFSEHNFQVWQQKNDSYIEPFETGLFVQNRDGRWVAYTLDVDGLYKPRVFLSNKAGRIEIRLSGKVLGVFDPQVETYRREADGALFEPEFVDGTPPSNALVEHR